MTRIMRGFICFCCLAVLTFTASMAQPDNAGWMAVLPDTVKVCRVSIPGTHDSGTAGVRFPMKHYARTQTMDLSEQWDSGIRFFDLRPKLEGDKLKIYHGPANCHLEFEQALLIFKQKLEKNPKEFCIVMINMAGGGQKAADMMMELICRTFPNDILSDFKPGMTVADTRGKILFIHRNAPSKGIETAGAVMRGWPGNGSSYQARILSSAGESAVLWVQDYFTSGNNDKDAYLTRKWNYMHSLLSAFSESENGILCINHTSGYTGTGIKTNIKRCSDTINKQMLDYLKNHNGPIGIIPMDFPSLELINAIIRCNGLYLQ